MRRIFSCPNCHNDVVLPAGSKKGLIYKCEYCGQFVRLRIYLGVRIKIE